MDEKKTVRQAVETVRVERRYKGSVDETEFINIIPFVTQTANVSLSIGATVKVAEWESARFMVTVTVPTYLEEIEEAKKYAEEQAITWLEKIVKEIPLDERFKNIFAKKEKRVEKL